MNVKELELVSLDLLDWEITHHQLFNIDPDKVDTLTGCRVSPWGLYFVQDLLQAVSKDKSMLLDVGWYPEADPSGSYRAVVLTKDENHEFDWFNPRESYETNSLSDLIQYISNVNQSVK